MFPLKEIVLKMLREEEGVILSTNELADRVIERYPKEVDVKIRDSTFLNSIEDARKQLKREIAVHVPRWLSSVPGLEIVPNKVPRSFVVVPRGKATSDVERVQEMRTESGFGVPSNDHGSDNRFPLREVVFEILSRDTGKVMTGAEIVDVIWADYPELVKTKLEKSDFLKRHPNPKQQHVAEIGACAPRWASRHHEFECIENIVPRSYRLLPNDSAQAKAKKSGNRPWTGSQVGSRIVDNEWSSTMLDEKGKPLPRQMIVMGAPGTGKSWKLKKLCELNGIPDLNIYRVTFHPELSYGDFVGVYKPAPAYVSTVSPVYDSKMQLLRNKLPSGETTQVMPTIRYEYRCGPFIDAYCAAMTNPECPIVVIIEEINRASPAAVFGDILQLLDRDENDESDYAIRPSPDLQQKLVEQGISQSERLRLPKNLFIWGTMNRADESVNYVDSAFMRRWDALYLPYSAGCDGYGARDVAQLGITWDEFRGFINEKLVNIGNVEDDKCIGPYFLREHELSDESRIFSKLITYLWHDVVPMERDRLFKAGSLSQLYSDWMRGKQVLKLGEE